MAAAIFAASFACSAHAENASDPALYFETSLSEHFLWTEFADFEDKPKAWDAIASPEFAASLRFVAGSFEATAEIGALADRFDHFDKFDADSLRAYVAAGWNDGDWSSFLEWERFNVYEPGYGTFYVGFDTYDVFIARRFTASVIPDASTGQFTASLSAGQTVSTYTLLDTRFASLELEWVQTLGGSVTLAVAPKVDFNDYPHFSDAHRQDAIVSLRLAPSYSISKHITLTLEGKASFVFSTLETKSGEMWEITPTFRFQSAL